MIIFTFFLTKGNKKKSLTTRRANDTPVATASAADRCRWPPQRNLFCLFRTSLGSAGLGGAGKGRWEPASNRGNIEPGKPERWLHRDQTCGFPAVCRRGC